MNKQDNVNMHICGVRHHGPGSARSVRSVLDAVDPDVVLVEGPPEADGLIELVGDRDMVPPVALLIHRGDDPGRGRASFYPFAIFSPEWQALLFAVERGIPASFIDLPLCHQLADWDEGGETESPGIRAEVDPLRLLAEAAGCDDGEQWWEHAVELHQDGGDRFKAIAEAIAEVRNTFEIDECSKREMCREASMRRAIREAIHQGRRRIVVVCGAWHAPALDRENWPTAKHDSELLKGLPKTKVEATWVPWTYGRLDRAGGYGAGIASPGWYDHLWTSQDQVLGRWLTKVARLLRSEGLEASSASVIEAVRLVEATAALRCNPRPGLAELEEAIRAVFTFGETTPLELIKRRLIVGERMGGVPERAPMVPLQRDLMRLQKSLRFSPDPAQTVRVLDLREPNDRARSSLLHRLLVLDLPWGKETDASGKGTFKEAWTLEWRPEFAVSLIEASVWGSTVASASSARAIDRAKNASTLADLCELIERLLLADLPEALDASMRSFAERSAVACDVSQLMDALPPLAAVLRYGNVRQTDAAMVAQAFEGMVARIAIGLQLACSSLDQLAADAMFSSINKADSAIGLLRNLDHLSIWREALAKLSGSGQVHPKLAGRGTRILHDSGSLDAVETARAMSLAVSPGVEPIKAAAWVEGFLHRGGEVLHHDDAFFGLIDQWLTNLTDETFQHVLPLLRRAFSEFDPAVRRSLGEKARDTAQGPAAGSMASLSEAAGFDLERGAQALSSIAALLGLKMEVNV